MRATSFSASLVSPTVKNDYDYDHHLRILRPRKDLFVVASVCYLLVLQV